MVHQEWERQVFVGRLPEHRLLKPFFVDKFTVLTDKVVIRTVFTAYVKAKTQVKLWPI